jgi:putative ABC transport system permease protein
MFDLLAQMWLSASRRALTYFIAIVSLGLGVAAVVCLSALSDSFADSLTHRVLVAPDEEIAEAGSEYTLEVGPTIKIVVRPKQVTLDAEWVDERVRRAVARDIGGMAEGAYDVKVGRRSLTKMRVFAVSSDWLKLHPHFAGIHDTVAGRLFTPADDGSREAVCVIGRRLAHALSEKGDPVGQTIRVSGRSFRVVGVVSDDDNYLGGLLLISFSAARVLLRIQPPDTVSFLIRSDEAGVESEMADVQSLIGRALGRGCSVSVSSPWLDLEGTRSQLTYMRLFLGLVSLVPLVVGLLGMVSMLLANLNSRVHEIGVHRALGATRAREATLVLCEAGLTGLLASLAGIPAGLSVLHLLCSAWGSELHVAPGWIAVAVGAGLMTALLAGLIPARAAMRIAPSEALRAE